VHCEISAARLPNSRHNYELLKARTLHRANIFGISYLSLSAFKRQTPRTSLLHDQIPTACNMAAMQLRTKVSRRLSGNQKLAFLPKSLGPISASTILSYLTFATVAWRTTAFITTWFGRAWSITRFMLSAFFRPTASKFRLSLIRDSRHRIAWWR
jgi:hypothetical protein